MDHNKMNLITNHTQIEGSVTFKDFARFDGNLKGELIGEKNTEIVISQSGVVEGKIKCERIIIDGYVKGDIVATKRIQISNTGRVSGKISAPSIQIDFGAYFDGSTEMTSAVY